MRILRAPARALALLLLAAASAPAQDLVLERTAGALARGDRSALLESLQAFEQRDAQRQQEFTAASERPLPPKAAERLRLARDVYQAGHGRLLAILRELTSAAGGPSPALVLEAQQILARLEESARRQPISAELPVGAPALQAPLLGLPSGATSSVPIGPVPQLLKDAADGFAGVVEVYEWVRNAIEPEFYYGVMKGEVQTYMEQAGNDADTASVLVQMLRARGVPARYVRGTVQVTGATLMAVAGTATVEQAVRVLERAGIPHEVVLGAGGIASVKMERVWAEAYVPYANYRGAILDAQGKVWVPLDAGFKALTRPSGVDVATLGFDARATWEDYLGATQTLTPLEFVRERLAGLLTSRPGTTYDDLLNRRPVIAEVFGLLPNGLPYDVVSVTEVSYDLPDTLVHTVRLVGERDAASLLDAKMPVRDVLGRRLTLSYEPASGEDADVIASYGALALTPPYLVEVKPVVRSGGVSVAAGNAIGMGVALTLRMELATPGGTRLVSNTVLAGNTTAIGLGGREITAPEEGTGTAAEVLSGIARAYLQGWNDTDAELAALMKVVPLRPTVSACLVSSVIDVEYAGGDPLYPIRYEWKGALIDADVRASAPVGIAGREAEGPFLLLSGLQGSILENRIFETRHEIPSVSTAKALGLAASEGTTIHDLTSANVEDVLPGLPFDLAVKAEVRDAVARGFLVKIPALPVTHLAWTGVGYVILDEATSEAAYQLQGGHSGGVTAPSVINWPADLKDTLIFKDGQPPQTENRGVGRLQKLQSTDFQVGIVKKTLEKPLRVLVTDGAGYKLAKALVTFSVIGGGGELLDPIGGGRGAEVTVKSDPDGIAQVNFVLGTRTDVIPRFLLPGPGEEFATQVGLNMITARAELARLDEPFFALGMPDDRFDGDLIYADLTVRSGTEVGWSANLRVATLLSMGVNDPYGNPLSNFPVRVAYRPPPQLGSRPGVVPLRPANASPGGVLKPADYDRCVRVTPTVIKDQCAGEAPVMVVSSSAFGAYAYPLLGGSPFSLYYFDLGSILTPNVLFVGYPTVGIVCYGTEATCSGYGRRPDGWVTAGTRAVLVNALGNLVEAYPPGGQATAGFTTGVVYEKERIVNYPDRDGDHFVAENTNEWVREHLDNSQFTLNAQTPGTSVGGAGSVGNGLYEASMRMAPTPMLNTISWDAVVRPKMIPYLPAADQKVPGEVDPGYIDNSNPANPKLTQRIYTDRTWSFTSTFSLWGARARIFNIEGAPIFLTQAEITGHDAIVSFAIEPAAFAQALSPVQVVFTVERGAGESVLTANGSSQEATGVFRIPAGIPLKADRYSAVLRVLGVAGRDGGSLASDPLGFGAGIAYITVDTDNNTIVDDADDEAFRKDASRAFSFWEIDPIASDWYDNLVDLATIRVRVPPGLSLSEDITIAMPGSPLRMAPKVAPTQTDCGGKMYLCHEDAARFQRDNLIFSSFVSVPRPGDPFGAKRIPPERLQTGENQFLFGCNRFGAGPCPSTDIRLERTVGGRTFVISQRAVRLRPFNDLASLVSVRKSNGGAGNGASDHYRITAVERAEEGWRPLPSKDVKKITVIVHGFAVSDDLFKGRGTLGWFARWAKRLYWAGHPILEAQDQSATVGVAWPGDIPGPLNDRLYYPEDEFNAFQASIPFGKYIARLRGQSGVQRLNIFAHSLGNMVVHNGIKEIPSSGAPINFVMHDAAVPGEAFLQDYNPLLVDPGVRGVADLVAHAQTLGFPNPQRDVPDPDRVWFDQERTVERDRTMFTCPIVPPYAPPLLSLTCQLYVVASLPLPNECFCDGVTAYFRGRSLVNPGLEQFGPVVLPPRTPYFTTRWSKFRNRNGTPTSAWTGLFASNLTDSSIRVFNTYNSTDSVLRIDRGFWNPLSDGPSRVYAWNIAQIVGKPVGEIGVLSGLELLVLGRGRDPYGTQKWWTLDVPGRPTPWRSTADAAAAQNEVWGGTMPGGGTSREKRTREWAQLAMWYPAMAAPAGVAPIPALNGFPPATTVPGLPPTGRNVDLTTIGGDAGFTLTGSMSHSYLQLMRTHEVWRAYEVLRDLFRH